MHEFYAAFESNRGFVSMVDKPVEHAGSYCLPTAKHWGSKKSLSCALVARPVKNLIVAG